MDAANKRLKDFFQAEIEAEVRSGFARLRRVPDSRVASKLQYFHALSQPDQLAFLDCCAYWATVAYGFVIAAPQLKATDHLFYDRWSSSHRNHRISDWNNHKSVPILRAMVQQYKIDQHRKVRSSVTKAEFEKASSIQSVKAPELRKRAVNALKPLGYYKKERIGNDQYWCRQAAAEFFVDVDYGGRTAQFRYCVVRPEIKSAHPHMHFRFERAMGFGLGDWDYIIEENADDSFTLFSELVQYSFELPDRLRAVAK
jgi:hypothetical protein